MMFVFFLMVLSGNFKQLAIETIEIVSVPIMDGDLWL